MGNCQNCGKDTDAGEHGCPFAEDIADDYETMCNCCSECEQQCCMDI